MRLAYHVHGGPTPTSARCAILWGETGEWQELGNLCRTNDLPTSPWWADEALQGHLGGPFTHDGPMLDAFRAVQAALPAPYQETS